MISDENILIFFLNSFSESAEFAALGFLKKSIYFAAWAKIILAKYISAWLLAEGAVILSGLAYNGKWEDGSIKWNGGANVKLRVFEKSTRFQHYIDSFNINTNAWVMSYVYKRLRFLNSKILPFHPWPNVLPQKCPSDLVELRKLKIVSYY